jgi:hypothetical protein
MVEGPDSRYALDNYPLDVLFTNSQNSFLNNTVHIKEMNSILIPFVERYVEFIKHDVSMKMEEMPKETKEQFYNLMHSLFGDKRPSSVTMTNRNVEKNYNKLTHAFSVSYQLPKFLCEMSFVYIISKFEDFISDQLKIVFTRRSERLKTERKDKKITYEELFASPDLRTLKDTLIEREITQIMMKDIDDVNIELIHFLNVDLSLDKDKWRNMREYF